MMTKTIALNLSLLVALGSISTCKARDRGASIKSEEKSEHEKSTGDSCDNAAMAKRRTEVFNRSASCASDAIGFGIGDVIQKAALAAGEMKKFASAARKVQSLFTSAGIKASLNTTRAAYCASVLLGEYTAVKTIGYIGNQAINKSFQADIAPLSTLAAGIAGGGGVETLEAIHKLIEEPSIEKLLKVGTVGTNATSDVYVLFTTCGQAFVQAGLIDSASIVQIVGLKDLAAKIGVAAAIANCASAGLFNAIDVGTEAQCLAKDLETVARQDATINAAEQAVCENLKTMAADPNTRPTLQNTQIKKNTPESQNRDRLCRTVIFAWGRCLAANEVYVRNEVSCRKLCEGDNVAVQSEFDSIVTSAGLGSPKDIRPLVGSTTRSCITPGNSPQLVKDGLKPCIDLCIEGKGGETSSQPSYDGYTPL